MNRKAFGQLIASLRQELGWTQFQLAEYADLDENTLSNIERGVKKNLDPEILFRLANALNLTSLERREFFLASCGLETEQYVRQPSAISPSHLFDAPQLLADLKAKMAEMYAPVYLLDAYRHVIATNKLSIEIMQVEPTTIEAVRTQAGRVNALHFLYGLLSVQKNFGDEYNEFALNVMRNFRATTLSHRHEPDFMAMMSEFMDPKKYPLFERYWRKASIADDKEVMLDLFDVKHQTYGRLRFIFVAATAITPYGDLFLISHIPCDQHTVEKVHKMVEKVGMEILQLTPWP